MSRQPPLDWSPPGQFSAENFFAQVLKSSPGRPPVSRRVYPRTPLTTDSLETPVSLMDSFPWMLLITGQTSKTATKTVYISFDSVRLSREFSESRLSRDFSENRISVDFSEQTFLTDRTDASFSAQSSRDFEVKFYHKYFQSSIKSRTFNTK